MALAIRVEHKHLGKYEGHPVLTPLRDANEHLVDALKHRRIGINRATLAEQIALARARLDILEDAFGERRFQH